MINNHKQPLLEVNQLKKFFPIRKTFNFGKAEENVKAVNDISFTLDEGETFGLVGESGCGKSTTGKTILRLTEPTSGEVLFKGNNIFELSKKELNSIRPEIQMIFQDPYSSLNPKKKVGDILKEALTIHSIGTTKERESKAIEILSKVGLGVDHYYKHPHELSGGQRQRIGLARALIVEPQIVICDEPVSALDVSVQSQILNLLKELQDQMNLAYIFITHDISVVRHISDKIGVMYLGKIVENASTESLFYNPLHPYTEALLSAVPQEERKKERIILKGDVPSAINPPSGCVFHTRCPYVMDKCKEEIPVKKEILDNHFVACHLYE